eukprot:GSMAST32.ASY1.ANO1.1869.1 assembled CDS
MDEILLAPDVSTVKPSRTLFKSSLQLCSFIIFLSFKPSEPHLSAYLIDEVGLSKSEVNDSVYPIWTYAYFVSLLLFGGVSEYLRYTPIIYLGVLGRILTRIILLFGNTLWQMQLMQVTYAVGSVGEVIFFAYIYHCVCNESDYQTLTSRVQASYLLAHFLSGLFSDFALHVLGASIRILFWISFTSVSIAGIISLCYFTPVIEVRYDGISDDTAPSTFSLSLQPRFMIFTILWVLFNAVYQIVNGYEPQLYKDLTDRSSSLSHSTKSADFNGTFLSIPLLLGCLASLVPGYIEKYQNNSKFGESGNSILKQLSFIHCSVVLSLIVYVFTISIFTYIFFRTKFCT